MFIEFLARLEWFIKRKNLIKLTNFLIIMDNAPTHRSQQTIQYWQSKGLNLAYILAYTP